MEPCRHASLVLANVAWVRAPRRRVPGLGIDNAEGQLRLSRTAYETTSTTVELTQCDCGSRLSHGQGPTALCKCAESTAAILLMIGNSLPSSAAAGGEELGLLSRSVRVLPRIKGFGSLRINSIVILYIQNCPTIIGQRWREGCWIERVDHDGEDPGRQSWAGQC